MFQQKTWVSSQIRTVYMIISFLAMTVAVVFFLVAITNTEVKTLCGPFPIDQAPIYSSGIYNNDNSVSYWILNPPIWVGIAGKRKVKILILDMLIPCMDFSIDIGGILLHVDSIGRTEKIEGFSKA